MNTKRLLKLLKQKRQLSGLTQAEVANKLHVSRKLFLIGKLVGICQI